MKGLVNPHGGGELKPLLLKGDELRAERERAGSLKRINISSREVGDLIMLGIGGFTPLTGFMTKADWQGVCDNMQTADGLFWPIPITLSTDADTADGLTEGEDIALFDTERNEIMATMTLTEKYGIDSGHECQTVFTTTDEEHPGVKMVMAQVPRAKTSTVATASTGKPPHQCNSHATGIAAAEPTVPGATGASPTKPKEVMARIMASPASPSPALRYPRRGR